jgi:hypothetical protein
MTATCPPHRWEIPGAHVGPPIGVCVKCEAIHENLSNAPPEGGQATEWRRQYTPEGVAGENHDRSLERMVALQASVYHGGPDLR